MQPQIITVHDIHAAIEDVGIVPYANTLVQEMGGGYFFVDAELLDDMVDEEGGLVGFAAHTVKDGYNVGSYMGEAVDSDTGQIYNRDFYMQWQAQPIPQKIAYFIIQALQLKSRISQLGIPPIKDIFEGSMAVYLTPGTEIFGHKVEKLTEIEAVLRPVVVERL